MYLSFYGLRKQPFHITPDPEFLYLSPSHKEALAAIIYGIEQKKGFVTITGVVGVGKTTILRSYLEGADKKRLKIVYVFNSKLTFEGLLKTVFQELGLPAGSNDVVEMVDSLYQVLIDEYKQDNTVVLVIDEAQNMPIDTLESLRMISNLETSRDKLIQVVLVGQPEFEEALNLDRLRQLKQRLAIRSTVLPLTKEESLEYIKFRLQKAGSPSATVFTASALRTIVKEAKGIPRLLNVLSDNALITGFGYQKKPVTKKIVKEIASDFGNRKRSLLGFWRLSGIPALAVLLAGLFWVWPQQQSTFGELDWHVQRKQAKRDVAARQEKPALQPAAGAGRLQPATGKTEHEISSPKDVPAGATRTVSSGDTLSRLARDVYGDSSGEVMRLIRDRNPQITDPDIIYPGTVVVFPNRQHTSTSRWTSHG